MRKFNNYDLDGQLPVLAWNPLAMRCNLVGDGCRNCWHLRMCDRLARNHWLPPSVRMAYEGGDVVALKSFYETPPTGRVIAVQFMGDLWHKEVPQSYRDNILSTIRQCPGSVFLLLTKRLGRVSERMPDNAWLGTSAWDQPSFCNAMKSLSNLGHLAKHMWLSVEPLIGPIGDFPDLAPNLKFVAVGPETIGGHEQITAFTERFVSFWGRYLCGSSVVLYDKRKDWTARDWPGVWKNLKGRKA